MDPALLEAWVSELREARKHGDDAFHAFAVIGPDRDASPERMQTIRQQSVEAQRNSAADLHEQVILDYAKAGADAWITDSVIFGVRPQRPGDLRVDGLSGHALTGVVTQSAAVQGMIWNKIALAPQTEADEGSVRNHEGAQGRSIHSPTFTLNGQRLFYLIRGSVGAYVTIDSHRLNKGPLHASMYQTFDDPVGKLRWVEHNVRDYTGHNAHVEFTPHGDKPFELLRVVLADDRPAVPEGNAVVATMLEDEAITTPDALAVAYGKLLTQALDRFAADKIVGSPDAADMAALANVILTRTDLFPRSATNTAAAEYASRRQTLITQIKTDSHLAPAMFDGSGEDNAVFIRGSYKSPGDTVPRRFLEALGGLDHPAPATGSGRLELAQQIVDDAKDPFVSRVQVNRIWHHLFGRGIVATIDNLGVLGAEPTHPQLLDHLAWRFTHELKWSNKAMVRAIVLSRTYRMDSRPLDEHAEEIDPQNKLLHRTNIRRLEGEAIRDEILAVSGRLNDRAYGPSVDVYLTPFMEGRGRPKSGPLDGDGRRSVYTSIRRNFLPPMMLAFDMPIPYTARPMRTISNVPAQALIMMNDPFVVDQAKLWAKHVCDDKQATPKQRVESMYERAFCRKPDERELAEALDFVGDSSDPAVWADLGHVLMNVKEFIFLH
ncbi:MAG: DUF1553 domain-containing protein [Planctomycetes bacterium]|nr:DUF1553 domain-containing protein [Planctomycetota bacterium]